MLEVSYVSLPIKKQRPFFQLNYIQHQHVFLPMDEKETSIFFIHAIMEKNWDDVQNVLSRSVEERDMMILEEIFAAEHVYKTIPLAPNRLLERAVFTDSLFVKGDHGKETFLHIHLIKEAGNWKVIGVEKE